MNNDNKDFAVLKSSPGEIEVPKDNPFQYDELEREAYAKTLTNVVRSFQNGTVIALNGAWGTGKTTFIRMWKQYLDNYDFPVVYYNAWEDDISEEPLFSMIKSLKSLSKDESSFDVFVEKVGKFIVGALFGAVKSVAGFGGKVVADSVKGGVDQIEKDCIESLKSKDNTTTLLNGFKDALSEYVTDIASRGYEIPLVYFVDELDRCNPTFAVKVLERIKHLFEVPNVVFVLSVDKKQLALSINGYFGSEQFDSNEYLRRFIDIEYNMPTHVAPFYFNCLEKKYGITQVFSNYRLEYQKYEDVYSYYSRFVIELSNANDISLRQLEKIFTLVQLMLFDESFVHTFIKTGEEMYFIPLCFFMAYLKVCNNDIYQSILSGNYSLQELSDALENLLPEERKIDYFYERTLTTDYDHNELCVLLVLAHYCESTKLNRERFMQEAGVSKKTNVSSLQELNCLKFKRISPNLLIKHQSLFDSELKSIFVWIDKMEMF